ncbi:MAG: PEP-CTERM sorting domain-containing protein [Fimbriimonadaceae bacterium]|nr:PEP-CTERM sorting domain-containing protein [Fimbriimonadaceae bacterium]
MQTTKYATAAAALAVLAVGAQAITITNGFEAPDYSNGSTLTGANGWTPISEGTTAGLVQTDIVKSGSQAVRFDRTATSPATFGAYVEHSGWIMTPEHPVTTMEWDMYALDGSVKSDLWGMSAFWGLEERMTVGINQNNKLTVRNGWIGTVETNTTVARNVWNRYRIDIDYIAKNASVYFNDAFIGQWAILPGPAEHWGTAIFNRSFGGNDGAVFDGLSIATSAPVPEPASLAALGIGAIALIRRRRNRG